MPKILACTTLLTRSPNDQAGGVRLVYVVSPDTNPVKDLKGDFTVEELLHITRATIS